MNVNAIGAAQGALPVNAAKNEKNSAVSKTRSDQVSLSRKDAATSMRAVTERSLAKILETTRAAAQELGIDLETFDPSPEAVSSRIADFAIGLFGLYRQQNPDMGDEDALNSYQSLINGAIDQGYQEALGVLSGLGINDQGILDTAQKTIDMAHEKFNAFIEHSLKLVQEKGALPDEPPPVPQVTAS